MKFVPYGVACISWDLQFSTVYVCCCRYVVFMNSQKSQNSFFRTVYLCVRSYTVCISTVVAQQGIYNNSCIAPA